MRTGVRLPSPPLKLIYVKFVLSIVSFKISKKLIVFYLILFSLLPRLFTPFALQIGTLYILLFWLPFLVILPEITHCYESRIKIKNISKSTLIISSFIFIIILVYFIFRDRIFDNSAGVMLSNVRRSFYLVQPLICLSVYESINDGKKRYFLFLVFFMTFLVGIALLLPTFLQDTVFSHKLNYLTAMVASFFFSMSNDINTFVDGSSFGNSKFSIKVMHGCSSLNQIVLNSVAIIIFYICCRIISIYKMTIVILLSILFAFLINSIRIYILAILVSVNKHDLFEFWHTGSGSLLFSLVSMFIASFFYYHIWKKENPIT